MNVVYGQFWPIGMPLLLPLLNSALAALQRSRRAKCHTAYDLGDDYRMFRDAQDTVRWVQLLTRAGCKAFNEGRL